MKKGEESASGEKGDREAMHMVTNVKKSLAYGDQRLTYGEKAETYIG